MNPLDLVLLGVVGLSAAISLIRGFVREVLSVVVWVLAFWLSVHYAGTLALQLEGVVSSPTLRLGAAFIGILVVTLVAGALVTRLLVSLVGATGLGGTDRLLGVLFGAARGAVVVALAVLLLGMSPLTEERVWKESTLLPSVQPWICRAGADAWLSDLEARAPLPGQPLGEGQEEGRLSEWLAYWEAYCAGRRER